MRTIGILGAAGANSFCSRNFFFSQKRPLGNFAQISEQIYDTGVGPVSTTSRIYPPSVFMALIQDDGRGHSQVSVDASGTPWRESTRNPDRALDRRCCRPGRRVGAISTSSTALVTARRGASKVNAPLASTRSILSAPRRISMAMGRLKGSWRRL
jgi:hypothetical protein